MDWSAHTRDMSAYDLGTFKYAESMAVAIRKYGGKDMAVDRLMGKDAWDVWFSSVQEEKDRGEEATSYIIICSRAPEVFPGQPSPVSYLPLSSGTWKRLVASLHVHRSITRSIARRVAIFSTFRRQVQDGPSTPQLEITYSARTSAAFPDDVALSSAYLPDSKTSFSVFYGCSPDQMADIETSLRSTGGIVDHPLLCMGILGELERKRLVDLAEDLIDKFTVDSDFLENKHWDLNTVKMRESLAICLRSRTLLDQIRSFKRQLNKVLKEFDRLRQEESQSADMFETGLIIQQRIHDVLDEYDDKIDECSMMAENLSLAMQTGWSQITREDSIVNTRIAKANTTIALESQIENAQMRSIAVLGMIYLPLSCVGSIFSTTIFNWRPVEGEPVISNYIWILVAISAGLTALTILAWHLTTSREKIKQSKRSKSFDIELDRIA
ncbi:hypothetical protein QBC37DRAFT_435085 [Rhypophila decipiens]|uniref:Uncharacterized protein n=1 Tax=Rhypophila decipiens TaxID=261697 RepID=A0AAN6XTK2_9PEZI|nr:hypothetical protein QBC37DRAFT_435085 [Rhypophila decipiens]